MNAADKVKQLAKVKQQPLDYISSRVPPTVRLHQGILYNAECLSVLGQFPDNCVDTVITDPPYALVKGNSEAGFMGKKWDAALPNIDIWKECLRIIKPGGILLSFGGTRTFHRLTCNIEDAGFEIRDCVMWLYGQGFPKSKDISAAIDKKLGAERKVVRVTKSEGYNAIGNAMVEQGCRGEEHFVDRENRFRSQESITDEAKLWDGYGTGLKPAWEPILVAMKPCEGTFAENALKHGAAGLNIDGCRVLYISEEDKLAGGRDKPTTSTKGMYGGSAYFGSKTTAEHAPADDLGRWPANVVLDEEAARLLDEQNNKVSRFFYAAKASTSEKNEGLDCKETTVDEGRHVPIDKPYLRGKTLRKNTHPTCKPLALLEWLCNLTKTPKGGIVLDPFLGSGTTALAAKNTGRMFVGIEKEKEYFEIAIKRIQ